jgi:hypothetical protein
MDLSVPEETAAGQRRDRRADRAARHREPRPEIPADPGRTAEPGHRVSAPAIRRTRTALTIPPAPKRHTGATWAQFLHTQAATMLATGFSHVDCAVTLQRRYCLFVIEIGSRYVHIPGITANPHGPRTVQQIRNVLMDLADRAAGFRLPVRDRAGQFTASSDAVLAEAGIRVATNPPRSPRPNAYPEGSCSPPAPRSPTRCPSSARGICRRSWPSIRPMTTDGGPIAAASSARPGPTTPSLISPRSRSSAGPSSAAPSTSTNGPHRKPGQDRRPSSGTPDAAGAGNNRLGLGLAGTSAVWQQLRTVMRPVTPCVPTTKVFRFTVRAMKYPSTGR